MNDSLPTHSEQALPATVVKEGARIKPGALLAILLPFTFAAGIAAGYLIWGRSLPATENPQATQAAQNPAAAPTASERDPTDDETPTQAEVIRFDIGVDDDPVLGPSDAPITIIEFSDFNCGYCRRFHTETFGALLEAFPGQIRFVYRDFPVVGGYDAALAAQCAHEQGAFWDFHDLLFTGDLGHDRASYLTYANTIGLDESAFETCLDEERYADEVEADAQEIANLGARGTPTFFINGIPIVGALPLEEFISLIDAELAR
jgi:protein-disulfide isomerase